MFIFVDDSNYSFKFAHNLGSVFLSGFVLFVMFDKVENGKAVASSLAPLDFIFLKNILREQVLIFFKFLIVENAVMLLCDFNPFFFYLLQ